MKERPILFGAEMVRAILDGRKTQTRRVISPQPVGAPGQNFRHEPSAPFRCDDGMWRFVCGEICDDHNDVRCPFGQSGDHLWVRETWAVNPDLPAMGVKDRSTSLPAHHIRFRADSNESGWRWRLPLHMPRWASRITLEITAVRVERVQAITPADATAEAAGDIILNPKHPLRNAAYERAQTIRGERYAGIIQGYAALWDSLNAKRGYGWDVNPWVWVIEFKRVEQQRATTP